MLKSSGSSYLIGGPKVKFFGENAGFYTRASKKRFPSRFCRQSVNPFACLTKLPEKILVLTNRADRFLELGAVTRFAKDHPPQSQLER